MSYLTTKIEKVFPLLKNSFIPAAIFAFATIFNTSISGLDAAFMQSIHFSFLGLSLLSCFILLYFNQSRPIFFIATMLFCYLTINHLKVTHGSNYISSAAYINLCFFAPINLIIFYFLKPRALLNKNNTYILLALFLEFSIAEYLGSIGLSLGFFLETTNLVACSLFVLMCLSFFVQSSLDGRIGSSAMFFAGLCCSLGFFFSAQPFSLSLFFFSASLIVFISIIESLYYSTYKDILTGLFSRQSFMIDSPKFPLKYCIGIIAIDEYSNLTNAFGFLRINTITKMIATKISEIEPDNRIYRYSDDEFVLVFKNESKNDSFERMEKIRRAIASSEFVISRRKKALKLTVSGSLSEKKRSDGNAIEVLMRAHKSLQKTYKFTQNVTTKA